MSLGSISINAQSGSGVFRGPVTCGNSIVVENNRKANSYDLLVRFIGDVCTTRMNMENVVVYGNVTATQLTLKNCIVFGEIHAQESIKLENVIMHSFSCKNVELTGRNIILNSEAKVFAELKVKGLLIGIGPLKWNSMNSDSVHNAVVLTKSDIKAIDVVNADKTDRKLLFVNYHDRIVDLSGEIENTFKNNARWLESSMVDIMSHKEDNADMCNAFERHFWNIMLAVKNYPFMDDEFKISKDSANQEHWLS